MTQVDEAPGPSGPDDNTADRQGPTLTEYLAQSWERIRLGDLGAIPIAIGLVIIVIVFGSLDETFLTSRNFTNLMLQIAAIAVIAIGTVFVLLIAEIDLSVAFLSAVGGVVMALLLRPDNPGWPWWLAIITALLVTTGIGWLQGIVITKAGVPSFVVTLAGFLVWSGVVLILMTSASQVGSVRIQDQTVIDIANSFLTDFWGWVVAVAVVGGYAGSQVWTAARRRAGGLTTKPTSLIVIQVAALAIVTVLGVAYANQDRGVPRVAVLLAILLLAWTFVASRLRFGRHVYAIGGNPEAARRAGIKVDRIRVVVFMISGFMAGAGGIVLASRLRSVSTGSGGGNLLLLVIAAAVIGGTSLFGGQGRVMSALFGALVIGSIQNGMDLLGLASGTKFVITGLVLVGAVLIDAWAKQRRSARGIA